MNKNSQQNNKNSNSFKNIPFIGSLRTIELVGIGLLLLAGLMYGVSKCSRSKSNVKKENVSNVENTDKKNESVLQVDENDEKVNALRRRIYVTMDSIKMRKGPHKDSALAKILPFGEELIDMGDYQNEQTIRIAADNVATEPWIKVRTKEGMTGWVFGGGVRPYPKKKPEPKKVKPENNSETEEKTTKDKTLDSKTKSTKTETKTKEDSKSKTTKKDPKKDS